MHVWLPLLTTRLPSYNRVLPTLVRVKIKLWEGYIPDHQIKVASAAFFCAYLTTPLSPVVVVSWCHFYATILVGRDYQKLTITYAVYTLHRPTFASREQEANEVGQVTQNEQGTSHRPPYQ